MLEHLTRRSRGDRSHAAASNAAPLDRAHRRRTRIIAPALALGATICALGVSAVLATAKTTTKPVLTIGEATFASSYNPDDYELAANNAYGGILTYNHDSPPKVGPGFASAWKVSDHNQTITLTFRHDVGFDNGTLLTAPVEKGWLTTIQKNKTLANTYLGQLPKMTVSTRGKWTLVVHFASPYPLIAALFTDLAGGLAHPVETRCQHNIALLDKSNCGAGPYMVDFHQSIAGSKFVYVPNPYYYDKSQQRWSKIVELSIPNASSMLQALQSGQIQVAEGDSSTVTSARAAGFKVVIAPRWNCGIEFNLNAADAAPLKSLAVRQALNYAVNRNTLAKAFSSKPFQEVLTWDGVDPNPKYANYYSYNPAKAKQLLAAGGYPNGFTINVLTYGPYNNIGTPLIQAIASQEAAIGVKFNIIDAATFSDWVSAVGKGYPAGTQAPFGSGQMYGYVQLFAKGLFGWTDPVINNLYNQLGTASGNRAIKLNREITDRFVTQGYWLPVIEGYEYWYENPHKVKGLKVTAQNRSWNAYSVVPAS